MYIQTNRDFYFICIHRFTYNLYLRFFVIELVVTAARKNVRYLVIVELNFSDFQEKYQFLTIAKHKLFKKTYIAKFEYF